jgi:hypothetical protein
VAHSLPPNPSRRVGIEPGLDPQPLDVAPDQVVDKMLQEGPLSSHGPESQRFHPPACPLPCILRAVEVHEERPAAIPEPVTAGRRDQRNPLIAHRRVQIHSPNPLEKTLFEEPLLHPHECRIVVLHRDHQRALLHQPLPGSFRDGSQINARAADKHEQQAARGKLVLATQNVF